MRSYALVVLDSQDKIVDRYNLDLVTNPTGNGFELDMSVISSDLEDVITKVVQKKNKIIFNVPHVDYSYQKAYSLASWIQKYSTKEYQMALEYNDGVVIRYCDGKVTKLEKTENSYINILQQRLEFTQTTPYYLKVENSITMQQQSLGKTYPFTYPYKYGKETIENNEIVNPYILDIPLIVTISGAIDNPRVILFDENNNNYNVVSFDGISLADGEQLVINSAQRKIYKIDSNGGVTDFVNKVNPAQDTFLRAKRGKSRLYVNMLGTTETFKLVGGWRQYIL